MLLSGQTSRLDIAMSSLIWNNMTCNMPPTPPTPCQCHWQARQPVTDKKSGGWSEWNDYRHWVPQTDFCPQLLPMSCRQTHREKMKIVFYLTCMIWYTYLKWLHTHLKWLTTHLRNHKFLSYKDESIKIKGYARDRKFVMRTKERKRRKKEWLEEKIRREEKNLTRNSNFTHITRV